MLGEVELPTSLLRYGRHSRARESIRLLRARTSAGACPQRYYFQSDDMLELSLDRTVVFLA